MMNCDLMKTRLKEDIIYFTRSPLATKTTSSSRVAPHGRCSLIMFLLNSRHPAKGRAFEKLPKGSFDCPPPRKSLVKGERFVRFEGRPEHNLLVFRSGSYSHVQRNACGSSLKESRMRLTTAGTILYFEAQEIYQKVNLMLFMKTRKLTQRSTKKLNFQ